MNKAVKTSIITVITAILAISFSVLRTSAFCDYQFKNGYEKAIEEAVLVESNEEGYILSFEGELHNYSFEGELHSYTFESKIEKTFENGYEQAIEDAVLVSSDERGYVLSFEGELHAYTFD